ncbi:MAG: M67 family metallopeptidase [Acidimicrobiales bacterium]
MPADIHTAIVAHCIRGLPEEACGLVAGDPAADCANAWYPAQNIAHSARVYTLDPVAHLRADRDAEGRGQQILGVFHSHTHTDAYPSSTDVAQAPDPGWHYLIVSLRDVQPVLRSYRIVDGQIEEESVVVQTHWAKAS